METAPTGPKGPGNQPVIACDSSNYIYPSTATGLYLGVQWNPSLNPTPIQPAPSTGTTFSFTYTIVPYPGNGTTPDPMTPAPLPCPAPVDYPPDTGIKATAWSLTAASANFPSTGGSVNNGIGVGSGNLSQFQISFPAGSTTNQDYLVTGTVGYNYGSFNTPIIVHLAPAVIRIEHS